MRVVRTEQAERDLLDIWSLVARDNLAAADHLIDDLESRTALLSAYPELGPEQRELGNGVRSLSVRGYLVLYEIRPELILILRYAHGRRRLTDLV